MILHRVVLSNVHLPPVYEQAGEMGERQHMLT